MESTLTIRGQTVVPAEIRKRFNLTPALKLQWLVTDEGILVKPVAADPIAAFRGSGKGGGTRALIADRDAERKGEKS